MEEEEENVCSCFTQPLASKVIRCPHLVQSCRHSPLALIAAKLASSGILWFSLTASRCILLQTFHFFSCELTRSYCGLPCDQILLNLLSLAALRTRPGVRLCAQLLCGAAGGEPAAMVHVDVWSLTLASLQSVGTIAVMALAGFWSLGWT